MLYWTFQSVDKVSNRKLRVVILRNEVTKDL